MRSNPETKSGDRTDDDDDDDSTGVISVSLISVKQGFFSLSYSG